MMVNLFKKLLLRQRELVLYCLIGVSGVTIDYFVFTVLTSVVGIHYQIGNAISVSMGICNNFIWNARFNFKVKDRLCARFCSFYVVGLFGLAISAALLYLYIGIMHWNVLGSKLAIIFIVTIVQYSLNKVITFRKRLK